MKTAVEAQLRKVALGLTALVLLLVVWGGARLLLKSEPEPIVPAKASLQVDELKFGTSLNEELPGDIVSRPVFWQGRQPYTPDETVAESAPEKPQRNSNIDAVALQGVYTVGDKSGVIVAYKDERRRLQLDESIAGWTFTMLNGAGAVFENGGERKELPLEHALSGPAPKTKAENKSETRPQSDNSNKQDNTGE
jgi:hypothetical protein